jgi:uncharacterized protein YbjT (DUF2867 family)
MMSDTILVTGSTGKVGSQVVEQLAAAGANIRAAVQATSNVEAIKRVGAQTSVIDFNDRASLGEALRGVGKVFLIMPLVHNMAEVNAGFVEEAAKAGVKQIVKLSVLGADAEPTMVLAGWHREMEKKIEESEIPFTFIRPTHFMQNFLEMPTIKSQATFYQSTGEGKSAYVDTADIAAVSVKALTESGHEGKFYEITGPEALSNYDVAEILSRVSGKQISYVDVSEDVIRSGMKAGGLPEWLIESLIELNAFQKAGKTAQVSPDVEKVTGRKPKHFEQWAGENLEAFR